MSFTNWKSWASGDTETSADLNTYLRDNGRWLSHNATGGAPTCRVHNSALQTISDSTGTAITFDSERFDLGGMHSVASNTSRLTVPSGGDGVYMIGGHIVWAAGTDALRRIIQIKLNGTTNLATHVGLGLNGQAIYQSITTFYSLAAADYVELVVRQESGGNLNINASSNDSPEFWACWVGEHQ